MIDERGTEAILKFPLPESQEDLQTAIDGYKWKLLVWDIDQYLRNQMKYGNLSEEAYQALEKAREQLHEVKSNYNLNLE